jgi:uncharacterized protein
MKTLILFFRNIPVKLKTAYLNLITINDKPEKLSLGFALGSFIGMMPLFGVKWMISLGLASWFKWNKMSAVMGVFNTNMLTAPAIYAFNYKVGTWVLGIKPVLGFSEKIDLIAIKTILFSGGNVVLSLVAGGIITGLVTSVMLYFLLLKFLKKRGVKKEKKTEELYAIITGASKGLGRAMAFEMGQRGKNVLLVSLHDEGLPELCRELRLKYNIKAEYFETNLSENNSVYDIANWASQFPVDTLINNAGIGGTKAFDEASPAYIDNIIQINIRSTSLLTRLILPQLKLHKKAYILNVASMASFSPIAYKTVYPASKAFVYSFSRGLYQELKGTGIFVSVIHPGPMRTNPDVSRRIDKQGFLGKLGLISAEQMAKIAIRQLYRRDTLILPGTMNKINWLLIKTVPIWIRLGLVSGIIKREITAEKKMMSGITTAA